MSSLLGNDQLDLFVGPQGFNGDGVEAHHGVIPRLYNQGGYLHTLDVPVGNFEAIEDMVDGIADYFFCDSFVELAEGGSLCEVRLVDESTAVPEFHLVVLQHQFFDVVFQEVALVGLVHVADDVVDVEGRAGEAHGFEGGEEGGLGVLGDVAHEVVAAQTEADQVEGAVREVGFDSLEGGFQFGEGEADERDGAGHFAVETSAVEAERGVAPLSAALSDDLNVLALASACHAMHDEDHGDVVGNGFAVGEVDPVEADVAAVYEEDLLSFVGGGDLGGEDFVDGLEGVVREEGGGVVGVGGWGGLPELGEPEYAADVLQTHRVLVFQQCTEIVAHQYTNNLKMVIDVCSQR